MRFSTTTRQLLAVLALGFVSVGCGTDRTPTAPAAGPPKTSDLLGFTRGGVAGMGGLILGGTANANCTALPAATSSKTIGIWGGVITVGPHTLFVPPGAVTAPTLITATITPATVNSVQFQPEGLRFAVPTTLVMSYANCTGWPGLLPGLVYTSDALTILEVLPSVNNTLDKTLIGPVTHFSRYAVAW